MLSTLACAVSIIERDLKLGLKNKADLLNPLIFFLIIASLFPLAIGDNPTVLKQISPAIIWVSSLITTVSVMERLFKTDYEDGTLEQLLVSGIPLYFVILSKIIAHWLLTGLPLVIFSPILGLMLLLDLQSAFAQAIILFFSSFTMSLLGSMGVTLTIGLKRAGAILSIIILPLYIPVLIFGISALTSIINGYSYVAYLAIFIAMNIIFIILCPLIGLIAIRNAF